MERGKGQTPRVTKWTSHPGGFLFLFCQESVLVNALDSSHASEGVQFSPRARTGPAKAPVHLQAQKDDNKEAVGQHHRIGLSETQQRFLKTQRLREGLVSL